MEEIKKDIVEKLTVIFRKIFNNNQLVLSKEMNSMDVENWDSLSHMLMITEVEESFSIRFSLRELNHLKNVGNLIEYIEKKLSA